MTKRRRAQTKAQREYLQKLRDPRWQRIRLELMEEAGWECEWCEARDRNLQIHHGYYARREEGLEPWDYSKDSLFVLCEYCHKQSESLKQELFEAFGLIEPWYHQHIYAYVEELARRLDGGEELERLAAWRPCAKKSA